MMYINKIYHNSFDYALDADVHGQCKDSKHKLQLEGLVYSALTKKDRSSSVVMFHTV